MLRMCGGECASVRLNCVRERNGVHCCLAPNPCVHSTIVVCRVRVVVSVPVNSHFVCATDVRV
jgi:hypothetical protein